MMSSSSTAGATAAATATTTMTGIDGFNFYRRVTAAQEDADEMKRH
jgi:hypothetical protein